MRDGRAGVIFAVGTLYVITEISQLLLVGPNWFRWYMSDFGFVFWTWSWLSIVSVPGYIALALSISMGLSIEFIQFLVGNGDPIDVVVMIVAGVCVSLILGKNGMIVNTNRR